MVNWLDKITPYLIQALNQRWSGAYIRRKFLFEGVRFFEEGGGAGVGGGGGGSYLSEVLNRSFMVKASKKMMFSTTGFHNEELDNSVSMLSVTLTKLP